MPTTSEVDYETLSSEAPYLTSETETTSSQSTLPEEDISIWFDEKEEQNSKRQALNDGFESIANGRVSPLKSTLNADWNDISTTQQKYYIGKAKQMFAATLSVISPGQEQQLWQSIRQDPFITEKESTTGAKRKYFDINSEPIDVLVKAHNEAPSWQTKRQILSLFANDFSRSELQKLIPGLSKWRIDQARDHATKIGRGQTVPEKKIFRRRIDNAKVDHFLDYISRPQLLQDAAFGAKTLRLDSGEKIIIPAVVRTLIPSRIIEQYVCHSRQQGFEPAGERSLYRILDACSASVQQSLQGLDNITAEGTDAIDNLIKVVETLVENGGGEDWGATTASRIKEVKRYFKTDYKTHTSREEHCADHCTTYALSDPKNKVLTNIC